MLAQNNESDSENEELLDVCNETGDECCCSGEGYEDSNEYENCSDFKIFKKHFLSLAPKICLVFDKGAHCEEFCGNLHIFIKVLANLAGFVVSKTTTAQKPQKFSFPAKIQVLLASNNAKGSNLFNTVKTLNSGHH